jgi:polyketide biosynthesis acyl carrier protein
MTCIPGVAFMTTDSVLTVIKQAIFEVLPQSRGIKIEPTDALEQLGANSVERADIVLMVLEKLNLNISLVEVFGPRNIGDLAELLHAKL